MHICDVKAGDGAPALRAMVVSGTAAHDIQYLAVSRHHHQRRHHRDDASLARPLGPNRTPTIARIQGALLDNLICSMTTASPPASAPKKKSLSTEAPSRESPGRPAPPSQARQRQTLVGGCRRRVGLRVSRKREGQVSRVCALQVRWLFARICDGPRV